MIYDCVPMMGHRAKEGDDGDLWIYTGFTGEHADADLSDFEVMQSTGLRDRQGKEVWEGDIVEDRSCGRYGERSVVTWQSASFTMGDQYDSRHLDDECEILGNIYANPELLAHPEPRRDG